MVSVLGFDPGLPGYLALGLLLFASGFVRGYSGFGSSAVIIAALTPFVDPSRLVPVTIMIEVYASLIMAISIWRQVGWRDFQLMAGGAVLGSPLGVLSHFVIPVAWLKIIIQTIVLLVSSALLAGFRFAKPPQGLGKTGVGFLSGIINSAAGIGGLVIATFFMAGSDQPSHIRATLVLYFLAVNTVSAVLLTLSGLLTLASFYTLLMCLPVFTLGIWIGGRSFLGTSPEFFRKIVLGLLILIALAGLAHTINGLLTR